MRVLRLVLVVVVFAAALGASHASALPSREGTVRLEVENYTRGAFGYLGDLLVMFWNKEGCRIDPLGGCAPSPSGTEEGCRIDPWGRCADATAPAADEGCGIDPLGRCGS
jgi:hypothetical protein